MSSIVLEPIKPANLILDVSKMILKTFFFQVWLPVRLTSTDVRVVSVCLRLSDVMAMLTAATALMRWIAQDRHAAHLSCDAHTATCACKKSGSAMARMTAKMGQTRR